MCECAHKSVYDAFIFLYPCMLPCSYFSISCNVICQHPKRTDWSSRCAGNTTISIITYRKNSPCKNQFTLLVNALVKQLGQTLRAAWSSCISAQLNGKMFHTSNKLLRNFISLYATSFFKLVYCIVFLYDCRLCIHIANATGRNLSAT